VVDEGFGFTGEFAKTIERLIAAMAALLLGDLIAGSCVSEFALEEVMTGFGRVCVAAPGLQV
jgi:hypothetical protein